MSATARSLASSSVALVTSDAKQSFSEQTLKPQRPAAFESIVGESLAIIHLQELITRFAPHFRAALVTGPTGTGKELVAEALHRMSPVSDGPFIVCNCAA